MTSNGNLAFVEVAGVVVFAQPRAGPRSEYFDRQLTGGNDGAEWHNSILNETTFDVERGEIICLLGPSGAGKSSLLNVICGFERPAAGNVRIDGFAAEEALMRGFISVVFQHHNLLPWLSWFDNAGWFKRMRTGDFPKADVNCLARLIGLEKLEKGRLPQSLAGGEQQRVALIRALTMDARLLVMDEPFAALDYHRRKNIIGPIRERLKSREVTGIIVTHDVRDAVHIADRLMIYSATKKNFSIHEMVPIPDPRNESVRNDPKFDTIAAHVHRLMD